VCLVLWAGTMFEFYEKVRVVAPSPKLQHLAGAMGAILGRAQNEVGEWVYAVHIYGYRHAYSFRHEELESLGTFAERSELYPEDTN
jgi:hypothetical protein